MRILSKTGSAVLPWFNDILGMQSIATSAVDPVATYQASSKATVDEATMNKYISNGFGVLNATENSGYIYAITWEQFDAYKKANLSKTADTWALSTITPRKLFALGGDWILTPVVKVFADNDASYASTITTVNVGLII